MRSLLCAVLLAGSVAFAAISAYAAEEPGLATAIRTGLEDSRTAVERTPAGVSVQQTLQAAYARHEFRPFWSRDGKASQQAAALLATLRAADTYGLRPNDYLTYQGRLLAEPPSEPSSDHGLEVERRAQFDLALSAAAVRFITHVHFGRTDPRAAGFNLGASRPELDVGAVVERLSGSDHVDQIIASSEPQFYHYALLKEALARYRPLAADPGLSKLPAPRQRSVKPGQAYEGAPALRKLLVALGDLPLAAAAPDSDLTLDPALADALKRFQARHGLDVDGAIGTTTFTALSTPLAKRVRQIELTLERWRWLPQFESPPIIVNIPQFTLFAFKSTRDRRADILQMDVIVGQTHPITKRTPVFAEDMKFVILRPYWDVPYSITLREMLPKLRKNPGYLAAQHLEIVRGQDDSAAPLAPTPENIEALAKGQARLRQQPGADNALGLVKFMLPNAYNVYLHSTPAHRLFGETRRAFSHGCIRVSDPTALAAYVLRNEPGNWTPAKIDAAMNGSATLRVNLQHPIRVMILYATALATEAGPVLFFDDLYGYDRKLEALLGLPPVPEG
jgi:murein L,D-transpeptidase YcbB/YkuD